MNSASHEPVGAADGWRVHLDALSETLVALQRHVVEQEQEIEALRERVELLSDREVELRRDLLAAQQELARQTPGR